MMDLDSRKGMTCIASKGTLIIWFGYIVVWAFVAHSILIAMC